MRRVRSTPIALIVAAVLTTHGAAGWAATPGSSSASRLVVAVPADPTTLDPHMHYRVPDESVCSNMFDSLVAFDRNGVLQPSLAVAWEAVGSKEWRFTIRKGVRFHNGEILDAETVRFSLERVMSPSVGSPQRSTIATIERVEAVEPYVVAVHTAQPDPILPARLSGYAGRIVPRHYIEEKGNAYFAANPVGTGPYRFVRWVRDSEIVLDANPSYWRGAPAVKQLVFRTIPEASSRVNALISGEVDVASDLSPDMIQLVTSQGRASVRSVAANRVIRIAIDCRSGPTSDVRVRQALNYAVDFDDIVEHLLGGFGTRVALPVLPEHLGYDPSIRPYPHDPEKARKLLAEAGYADGFDIVFDTPVGRFLKDVEVASAVAGQLRRVGVRVTLRTYEVGTFVQLLNSDKLGPLYLHGWSNPLLDADGTLIPLYGSGQRLSRFSSRELDGILASAQKELSREKRQALYAKACRILYDECPDIFGYQQHSIFGVRKGIVWEPRYDELVCGFEMRVG